MPGPRRLAWGASLLLLLLPFTACDSPSTPKEQPPQTPAAWLAENAHPIASLSVDHPGFADLQPLKAAIGDARVVMLGEQSHGDGTTFLAKARLIAFLHQEMGFDVLAWESGIWDVRAAWDQVVAGADIVDASRRAIFGVWTRSEQVLPTLDYVESTLGSARPLEMAGFDNQYSGTLSHDSAAAHVERFARRIGSAVADDPEWPAAAATLTELATTLHYETKPTQAEEDRLLRLLRALREDAGDAAATDREALWWGQALESIESFATMMWAAPPGQFGPEDSNTRDRQMARNLVWLADVWYPDRKIVVWAHSGHIARNLAHLRFPSGHQPYATGWTVQMGAEAHRTLGDDMYVLGFTAATGSHGIYRQDPVPLPAPLPGSLEAHFVEAGFENAFVDFRSLAPGGGWLRDVMARPIGYIDLRGDWTSVYDGMVFTRVMTPSTPASR